MRHSAATEVDSHAKVDRASALVTSHVVLEAASSHSNVIFSRVSLAVRGHSCFCQCDFILAKMQPKYSATVRVCNLSPDLK